MRGPLSTRAWVGVATVVAAVFGSLAMGDPSPVLVSLPLAVFLVIGLLDPPRGGVEVDLAMDTDRVLAGTTFSLHLTVRAGARVAHVGLGLPPEVEVVDADGGGMVGRDGVEMPIRSGQGTVTVEVKPLGWGTITLGPATVTVPGPMRMSYRQVLGPEKRVVVLPDLDEARRLVEPLRTNMHAGDVLSSARGPGSELAELRRWAPGDSRRMINWRATARSDEVWVTDRYADRNGDLILVVDAVAPSGSTLTGAVTAVVEVAACLVASYGAARHRLGLVTLQGQVGWFGLGSGAVHEHRLLAALFELEASRPPVWMAVDRILDRSVRPPSMVVFLTPLVDDAVIGRIHRLSRAGMDVVVIAVDATAWIVPTGERIHDLARRIWILERRRTIDRLRASGAVVAEWESDRSVDEVMEEVERWRRRLRRARV